MHIQNAQAITQPWLHIFLYGDTGSGKTTAAATMPTPLMLMPASEGSELTLAGQDIEFIKLGRDANNQHIDAVTHTNIVLAELEERMARFNAGDDAAFPWETIVLENWTHYCDMVIASLTNDGRKPMDMQGWGKLGTFLMSIHTRLRRLPVHVVYTALAKLSEGEGKAQVGMPSIPGSVALKLPTSCDLIGYMEEIPPSRGGEVPTHRVHFRKKGPYMARTRFRGFPAYIDDFSFDQIAALCGLTAG
jgi:hypothetical protein